MTPGTKLGPYEIVALIGAGSMGEVYRGKDTKLKRDVAVKILPEVPGAKLCLTQCHRRGPPRPQTDDGPGSRDE